jgi:diaminopimelate decarboxylase
VTDPDLADLAARFGTPTYVLDLDVVRARLAELRAAFPDAAIRYAAKANALPNLLGNKSQRSWDRFHKRRPE